MKNRFSRLMETLRHIGARSLIAMLAAFIIVIGITAFAGNYVYTLEKKVLLQQGELNAKEASMNYNSILLTRVNIVTLAGCAVDHMMSEKEDNAAIETYMSKQTGYIIETLDPSTTGLYGWINETYIDGAGWVPNADYIPTERPWYKETLASDDDITFVEPYLDMQTKTVMMTVSSLLSDGKSVIAMDVSLDPLQTIVHEVASEVSGSRAFVLDASGIIVAHSDETRLGTNYLEDPGSLEHALASRIIGGKETQFDFETPDGSYSVYVNSLLGGWYSVSLINSDIWYRPLKYTMTAVSVILALITAFLVLMFLHLHEENQTLEKLHSRINQEEKRSDELQLLSETDRMTGLFDRTSGKRKVDELLSSGTDGMFLELDIDSFKSINDNFGHQAGDHVIIAVADALRHTFRANDVVMRLGGDEFGVFAVGIVRKDLAESIIQRLFENIDAISLADYPGHKVSVSVGVALCTTEGEKTFDDLYALADEAMYLSKKTKGCSLTFSSL